MENSPVTYKLLMVGGPNVGKTTLVQRFTNDTFNECYTSTIGIEFAMRRVVVDLKDVKLQIWDTAGQERYGTLTKAYYRGCHGAMIVYDITEQDSFESVPNWLFDVQSNCGENVSILLLGNKADMESERVVEYNTVKEYAQEVNLHFIETSAKDATNVEKAFVALAKAVTSRQPTYKDKGVDGSANAKTEVPKKGNTSRICTLL